MEAQDRVGAFALAELCGMFAFVALSTDGKERLGGNALSQYAEFLLKAEVLSQEELSGLWQQNSDPILLVRGTREACVQTAAGLLGGQVRYAFLELFSQAGGLRLTPGAADRCLRLLERLEKFQAPLTEEELAARSTAADKKDFLGMDELTAALERAAAGGGDAKEGGRALASLGCALSYGMAYSYARDWIGLPIFRRYAAAVSAAGFRGHRELAKLWDEEDGVAKPMREACQQAGQEVSSKLSHYLGLLVADVLGRTGGVALGAGAAEEAQAMIERVRAGEEMVEEDERRRLDEVFAAEFKGRAIWLKQELRRIAGDETIH